MLYDMWYDGSNNDEEVEDYSEELDIKVEPVELKECQVAIERLNSQHLRKLLTSRENYEFILRQLEENDDQAIQEGSSETSVVQLSNEMISPVSKSFLFLDEKKSCLHIFLLLMTHCSFIGFCL